MITFLFICACIVILYQFIAMIFGGDVEVETEFSHSDFFSFKGVTHFIFGFLLTLMLIPPPNGIIPAVLSGIVFTVGLLFLYRKLMSLSQYRNHEEIVENRQARVYVWNPNTKSGDCVIVLDGRETHVSFTGGGDYKTGDTIRVSGNRNELRVIN